VRVLQMILAQLRSYVVERRTTLELALSWLALEPMTLGPGLNLVVVQQTKEALLLMTLEVRRS
jgi:hypothetical protein